MTNQRGYISPVAGLVFVLIIAVVLIGRNLTTSSTILEYKMESNEQDLAYSLESIAMSLASTSNVDFDTNTDLVDTDSLEVLIGDYVSVVDLENPKRLMLTSDLTSGAFNKSDSKYEIVNNIVYKNLQLNLYPRGKDIIGSTGKGKVGSFDYSFQSSADSKLSQVNIGGHLFDKEDPLGATKGANLAVHNQQSLVNLNDYEGVVLLYPREVGDRIVEGSSTVK